MLVNSSVFFLEKHQNRSNPLVLYHEQATYIYFHYYSKHGTFPFLFTLSTQTVVSMSSWLKSWVSCMRAKRISLQRSQFSLYSGNNDQTQINKFLHRKRLLNSWLG